MPRNVSQDELSEVPCPSCDGVGFFGHGPYVEFCAYCHGAGVFMLEEVLPERKPVGREERAEWQRVVGDDVPF
jgi:hypothetical protein